MYIAMPLIMWIDLDECVLRERVLGPTSDVYQVDLGNINDYRELQL